MLISLPKFSIWPNTIYYNKVYAALTIIIPLMHSNADSVASDAVMFLIFILFLAFHAAAFVLFLVTDNKRFECVQQ